VEESQEIRVTYEGGCEPVLSSTEKANQTSDFQSDKNSRRDLLGCEAVK
jgi:hypothetical protein